MCHLGCLSGMCSLLSPFPLLTWCPQSVGFEPLSPFPHDVPHKQPWHAALVVSVEALVVVSPSAWWHSWFAFPPSWTLQRPSCFFFGAVSFSSTFYVCILISSLLLSMWPSLSSTSDPIIPATISDGVHWSASSDPPPPPLSPSDDLEPPRVTVGWVALGSCFWHWRMPCRVKCHCAAPVASSGQPLVFIILGAVDPDLTPCAKFGKRIAWAGWEWKVTAPYRSTAMSEQSVKCGCHLYLS
jgi:hypothetical protein